jgi:hypothetical protein
MGYELSVFDEPLRGRVFWKFWLWVTAVGGSLAASGAYGLAIDSFSRLVDKHCVYVSPFDQPHLVARFIAGIANGFYDMGNLLLVVLIVALFSLFGLLPRPVLAPFNNAGAGILFAIGLVAVGWFAGLHHTFGATQAFIPGICPNRY